MIDPAEQAYDEQLRADQYLHRIVHSWTSQTMSTRLRTWCRLQETVGEEWIPGDPDREWVLRTRATGKCMWVRGSYKSAVARGLGQGFVETPPHELRARHGEYYVSEQSRGAIFNNGLQGSWQKPTPEFFATLPRDPDLLLQRLRADAPSQHRSFKLRLLRYPCYVGPWVYAVDALRTGLVPADLRASLYRTLRKLPEVSIDSQASTLDGARAIALILANSPIQSELFVSPSHGNYIGERETVIAWNAALPVPPGTIVKDAALHSEIVENVDTPGAFA